MLHSIFKPNGTVKMFIVEVFKRLSTIDAVILVTQIEMTVNKINIFMTHFAIHGTFVFVKMVFSNKMN